MADALAKMYVFRLRLEKVRPADLAPFFDLVDRTFLRSYVWHEDGLCLGVAESSRWGPKHIRDAFNLMPNVCATYSEVTVRSPDNWKADD